MSVTLFVIVVLYVGLYVYKVIELCILNIHSSLYTNYTSVKLFKKESRSRKPKQCLLPWDAPPGCPESKDWCPRSQCRARVLHPSGLCSGLTWAAIPNPRVSEVCLKVAQWLGVNQSWKALFSRPFITGCPPEAAGAPPGLPPFLFRCPQVKGSHGRTYCCLVGMSNFPMAGLGPRGKAGNMICHVMP